jgi:hypothetical protein
VAFGLSIAAPGVSGEESFAPAREAIELNKRQVINRMWVFMGLFMVGKLDIWTHDASSPILI